jgi:hypothetical protein
VAVGVCSPLATFVAAGLQARFGDHVEISQVRRQLQAAIAAARDQSQRRRQRITDAERAYATFLADVATPLLRQLANALTVEGFPFTVSTPGGAVRLASDRGRGDVIEIALDAEGDRPQVVARITRSRGSRTIDEERPVKPDATPDAITEDELLEFLLGALEPFLAR